MKLVPRASWGARPYRQPSGGITYSRARRGVKLHYLGTGYSDRLHDDCAAYVRRIQASHMDGNDWSDIGYSFVVCTHGAVYEGRGLRRRNSANGNTTLNEECYAVLLLVGSSGLTQPTTAQLHGARDAIDYCREEGPAGLWLGGHRDGYATSCPGDAVYAWAKAGAPRPSSAQSEEDDMPTADEIAKAVVRELIAAGGVLENSDLDRIWNRDIIPAARPPHANEDYPGNATWSAKYAIQTGVESGRRAVALLEELLDLVRAGGIDTQAVIAALQTTVAPALADTLADRLKD
ncbi:peptidoglycan recognition family protein [Streptomyces sp. NPDC048389]|uniref:peptidoglycan recognition protein family protein n=1 Tax=Streptomyces sp. NPDC048389 TaxID=3154622 RepID=UPI003456B10E